MLGRTGIEVSEIGFGAWGIGGRTAGATSYGDTDDAVSLAALKTAQEQGITFFDTSNVYGDGHSEELIGDAFSSCRESVVIATKVGMRDFSSPTDFDPAFMRTSLEQSLSRLKTDYVDVLQLHNPTLEELHARPEIISCLQEMRSEGVVRAFGFSLKRPEDGVVAINEFDVDVLQVNVNMLDLRAQECGLLDLVVEKNRAIIARTPLNFGFLTGAVDETTSFSETDHRSAWPRSQIERWSGVARQLRERVSAYQTQSPSCVALRYCLAFEGVASVIPGMLTPEEVVSNAAASDAHALSEQDLALVAEINAEYNSEFEQK